ESGIPDFRSVDGLYHQKYPYPPETMLSHSFFLSHPKEFYDFHRDKIICTDAQPNPAHLKLAELEEKGKLKAIITQNIDGLHQKAGSKNVLELHGSFHRNYCLQCHRFYDAEFMLKSENPPLCSCGGLIRPDIVLYEESLDNQVLAKAIQYINQADILIVGGTSLVVYPAASLIEYYQGNKLILINKSATSYDKKADLIISEKIGQIMEQIQL
ncbi:MAG: NAD-dependent protein deacylase, partial [Clostridiales bacterium]